LKRLSIDRALNLRIFIRMAGTLGARAFAPAANP
jgi:hypothetical protein